MHLTMGECESLILSGARENQNVMEADCSLEVLLLRHECEIWKKSCDWCVSTFSVCYRKHDLSCQLSFPLYVAGDMQSAESLAIHLGNRSTCSNCKCVPCTIPLMNDIAVFMYSLIPDLSVQYFVSAWDAKNPTKQMDVLVFFFWGRQEPLFVHISYEMFWDKQKIILLFMLFSRVAAGQDRNWSRLHFFHDSSCICLPDFTRQSHFLLFFACCKSHLQYFLSSLSTSLISELQSLKYDNYLEYDLRLLSGIEQISILLVIVWQL